MWSYVFLFRIYNLPGAVPSGRLGTARRACPVRRPSSSTWPSWTRWRRSMEWLEMDTRYHILLIVKWNMLDQDKQLNILTYTCPISSYLNLNLIRVSKYGCISPFQSRKLFNELEYSQLLSGTLSLFNHEGSFCAKYSREVDLRSFQKISVSNKAGCCPAQWPRAGSAIGYLTMKQWSLALLFSCTFNAKVASCCLVPHKHFRSITFDIIFWC